MAESKEKKMEVENIKSKISVTESWVRKHRLLYVAATRHPFIKSIRDATVDLSSFKRWLEYIQIGVFVIALAAHFISKLQEQDYIFVQAFDTFLESVLLKAEKETDSSSSSKDIDVISGGVASIKDEISWFKTEAKKWGVSLENVIPQKANLDYCRFLENLRGSEVEYPVALTAFWAIETVYQDSFSHCLDEGSKTSKELKETCQRWGSPAFGEYCHTLQGMADHQLDQAPVDVVKKAEIVLLDVLQHEVQFWNMSQGRST